MESNAKLRWGAACLNCRKYKIRCDGAKPMCSRCVQFGRADCAYGRGPPPSLDARLQQQFADFGQRVGVIAPAGNQGTSRGASEAALATGSSSRSRTPASVTSRDPVPVEFPGPSDIPGLAEWDRQSELPPYTRQLMLEIFIQQRSQFSVDFHYLRWRNLIVLPASDPNSFHPSLVAAIALAAVSLCSTALHDYEALFRAHAEAHLAESLAFADRLEDSMWARIILAGHSMRYGRFMAALHMSTANVSLALGSNLHAMPGPDDFAQFNYGLLPAPINKQHAIERAHLWWSIYIIDVQLALTLNVQGQIYVDPLEPGSVLTKLPLPFDITPGVYDDRPQSASDILNGGCQWIAQDTLFCLRVKSAILSAVAGSMTSAVTAPNADRKIWERFTRLERATTDFINCMPRLDDMRGLDGGDGSFRPNVNPAMVLLETAVLTGALCLADVRAANDPNQRLQRLDLAIAGADMAQQLGDVALVYHLVTIGTAWYAMAETLIGELVRMGNSGESDMRRVRTIRGSLRTLVDQLSKLQGFYSGLRPYLEYVDAEFLSSTGRPSPRPSRPPDLRVSPFVLDHPSA